MDYIDYVRTTIMSPLGISKADFTAAKTLPSERDPREVFYISTWNADSVFTKGKIAAYCDEGFNADNWVSVGLGLTTPGVMSKFASAYKLPGGEPLPEGMNNLGAHTGGIDGLATFVKQLPNGVSYAIFMNNELDDAGYNLIAGQLDIDSGLPIN